MSGYVLMLLGDPGPLRVRLSEVLAAQPGFEPDPERTDRSWLRAGRLRIEICTGSKDPVESIHCEFAAQSSAEAELAARTLLDLAGELGMYVEDVQAGAALEYDDLEEFVRRWQGGRAAVRPSQGQSWLNRLLRR